MYTVHTRVMASQAAVPLIYVPLEAVFDKYFGESERRLSMLLSSCEKLDGCIIFLDELDALATSRYDCSFVRWPGCLLGNGD